MLLFVKENINCGVLVLTFFLHQGFSLILFQDLDNGTSCGGNRCSTKKEFKDLKEKEIH